MFNCIFFKFYTGVILMLLVINTTAHSQPATGPSISVAGEGLRSLQLTRNDLMKMTQSEVLAKDHGGVARKFSGVALVDVLSASGIVRGSQLRGKHLLKYVLVKAADNYEVVFSLAEIDPEFASQTILLAYVVDGQELPEGDGPYRLVVPNDKKHARWVRDVTSIKISIAKE